MHKKRLFQIIGCLVFIMVIFAGIQFNKTIRLASSTTIQDIALDQVDDGKYEGSSDFGLVQVHVEVMIKNHKIDEVNIVRHQNGLGSKAEQMTKQMIDQNRIDVDIISDATVSSKAIQKACGEALLK